MLKFQKILRPEKFNLILYYTVTSFIIIGVLSLAVGWIFPRMESEELIKRSEKYVPYFISHLNYAIYKDFFLPILKKDKHTDMESNRDLLIMLDNVIHENTYGLNIKKLYLFDMEGNIMYSTIHKDIGFTMDRRQNSKLDSALRGNPASALLLAGTTDSKGSHVVETLLESYYPFYEMEKGGVRKKQVGVLEIYQDMSELKKQIGRAREKAIIMTGSAMGILFLALFLIVFKAARVINTRTNQIIDARNTLELKVEERTQKIRDAYKKLQLTQRKLIQSEKLASIGTLVTGLAHEINNPLASVASCAEGLIERLKTMQYPREYPPSAREELEIFSEYLKIICDETYRCKSIISNLLNFSRQSEPKFDRISINLVIHDTLSIVKHLFQTGFQSIHLNLSEDPCVVIGDSQQLKQVFLNLIINAIHATEAGGDIFISTIIRQTTVQIMFKDTGVGIKPDHIDKIFDPFFTTKPTGKGTGLGLAICYGIIDIHNGMIEVSSEGAGKGSIFTITLPLAA